MKRAILFLSVAATLAILLSACRKDTPKGLAENRSRPAQRVEQSGFKAAGSDQAATLLPSAPEAQAEKSKGADGGVAGGVEGGILGGVAGYFAEDETDVVQDKKEQFSYEKADRLLVVASERKDARASVAKTAAARVQEAPVTQGTLRATKATGEPLGEFPLQHTDVKVDIGGYLARTVVRQTYANPYSDVIEAVYVFPLGQMAAVNDFLMEVGGRRIVGVVRPREEAERIYNEARARGQTASLLTQERPNIFTQNIANIEPGGSVAVTITTFERVPYEKGTYEYVFPMVVGPRYIPGNAQPEPAGSSTGGGGWSAPTDAVPEAHKITPPVLKPGERSGHDISLEVSLDAGLPIKEVKSVAHSVKIQKRGETSSRITLSEADGIPNRDFVLRWSVGGSEMQFGTVAHSEGSGGYFTLMVQPPLAPRVDQVSPREITFIMDVSGSMSGLPVETSKNLVRRVLDGMRPGDMFNIFLFASGNGQMWESPRPGTPRNVMEAKRFLESLQGSGGTEMLAGLRRAIGGAHDPKCLQMYVFATDGFVGDEARILEFVKKERGEARFFAFGIGSSVNRFLIEGVGREGSGKSAIVIPRDEGAASRAADAFFACIDAPVLTDVGVDWNGLPVKDAYPSRLGDLFSGGTVDLVARYTRPASGTAYVTGKLGGRSVRYPVKVNLPAKAPSHKELAPVWARYRIQDLSEEMLAAGEAKKDELVKSITDLAVKHRLASAYTAFVAVDESRVVGDGRPVKILQPVEMPEGVSYTGVFGENGSGGVSRVTPWGVCLQATASGRVRVGEVTPGSPAERSGIKPGYELKAVNGVRVSGLPQVEVLILQTSSSKVRATFEPGGELSLPAS